MALPISLEVLLEYSFSKRLFSRIIRVPGCIDKAELVELLALRPNDLGLCHCTMDRCGIYFRGILQAQEANKEVDVRSVCFSGSAWLYVA